MKNLFRALLIFLFFAPILFVGFGIFVSSFDYSNEVLINASKEEVWEKLTDPEQANQWIETLTRMEILEGEPNAIGTKSKLYFSNAQGEDPVTLVEEITAFEPHNRFAFKMDTDIFDGSTEITLKTVAGKTQLTATNTVHGKAVYWRSLLYLMKGNLRQQAQLSYDNLKELLKN